MKYAMFNMLGSHGAYLSVGALCFKAFVPTEPDALKNCAVFKKLCDQSFFLSLVRFNNLRYTRKYNIVNTAKIPGISFKGWKEESNKYFTNITDTVNPIKLNIIFTINHFKYWSCLITMLSVESSGLIIRTMRFLSFIAKAMGRKKGEVPESQCFACSR